jgi:hypothetical protein
MAFAGCGALGQHEQQVEVDRLEREVRAGIRGHVRELTL